MALAAAIDKPADNMRGMFLDWTITGNWSWQGLLFSHGGSMLNADESKVAFADAPGQAAIGVLRKFVDAGKMGDIRPEVMFQDFFAGRLGISMQSTAQLGRYNREIVGRFALKCRATRSRRRERAAGRGRRRHDLRQRAGKAGSGLEVRQVRLRPRGRHHDGEGNGLHPASAIPATRPDMLKGFYEQNPNHLI